MQGIHNHEFTDLSGSAGSVPGDLEDHMNYFHNFRKLNLMGMSYEKMNELHFKDHANDALVPVELQRLIVQAWQGHEDSLQKLLEWVSDEVAAEYQ